MRPFCSVAIKATRRDSPPWNSGHVPFDKLLFQWRLESGLSQMDAAARLGVSLGTFQNWELGRTKPARAFWPRLKPLLAVPAASEPNAMIAPNPLTTPVRPCSPQSPALPCSHAVSAPPQ